MKAPDIIDEVADRLEDKGVPFYLVVRDDETGNILIETEGMTHVDGLVIIFNLVNRFQLKRTGLLNMLDSLVFNKRN